MLSWLGLRSRLVLLVLAALVPVFVLFACSAAKNQQTVLALGQDSLRSEVLLAASHQQRLAERVAQLLGDVASGPSIKDTRNRLCVDYLKNLQAQNPIYDNLGIVGLDGELSCHAMDTGASINIADRAFYRQVLESQKFAIGEYAVSRSTGKPGIAFGTPVYSDEGRLNGVAYAAVGLETLAAALATDPIPDGARLRVLDRRGIVLASHPFVPGLPGSQEPDALVREAAQSWQPGARNAVDAGGVEQVYAYAPVSGTKGGLFVAISRPRDMLTAASREQLLSDFAALLGMTAFGMACAWAMGKRLVVNPANEILKEANEITRGNFLARVRLKPSHHDEIGRLGLAFNRMAESLQTQRDERDAALRQAGGERAMLDLILNSMSEGVIAVDNDGRFLLFNAPARKVFSEPGPGMLFDEWRLKHPLLSFDPKTPLMSDGPMSQTLRGTSIDNWDLLYSRPGGQDRVLRTSTRPLQGADKRQVGAVMVFIDVTELKAKESFSLAQEKVLELIAGGAPLPQSLDAVVRLIEKNSPESLCSLLLVKGRQLFHGAAPSLPESLALALDGLPVAEGAGACGTAAFRNAPVVVADVEHDPLMQDYRELLLGHGLRACWSTPVTGADGEVLASFAVYRHSPGKPQPADLALIASATRLARLALEGARAREALISSEARFRELAENVEDVFYNADAHNGSMRYISPGYEKIWGRSCESLYAVAGSHADAVLPEDRHILKLADELNEAGQMSDVQYRILSTDGQMRWIRDRTYPVLNAAGELERVVGTARDITESKLAHLALASSNRALQMLSRSSIAVNRIHDETALLAEVCRIAVEVGGYRMAWVGYAGNDEEKSIQPMAHAGEELGYLAAISLSWRADRPGGQGPAGQAIRTGRPQQSADISKSDNRFLWSEAAMQRGYLSALMLPLCNEHHSFGVLCLYAGEIQQFAPEEVQLLQELADTLAFGIVSLRARLERQRSEEAARQAAAKLHEQASLIDLSHDAIMVRNLDRTLRFWNKGAERLYGWTSEEVLGRSMEDLMYRSPQVLINVMEQTVTGGNVWTGELEQVKRDGSSVYVETRTTVLRDAQGQANGMLGVNTDIRERKQAREEILQLNASLEERVERRTAQLKFANQQLEAFSYSVSHDLRSPLSAVDGFCNLLEKSVSKSPGTPLTERSRHYLARIRAGVGQMGELIDAMLSLAQVTRTSLRWGPVDLSAQAEAVLLGLQEREPDRVVQWQVAPGLMAHGDPRLLRQVLDNLLGNAWKFTAGKASACITVDHEKTSAGETVFFVRDDGAGFDMAYVEKLFGAFQRLHAQSEFPGTGIGLATVQRIIARHGGRVWADSIVGRGATFYFTLGAAAVV